MNEEIDTQKRELDTEKLELINVFFRMMGLKGAAEILVTLDTMGKGRYKDMQKSLNTYTLNERIRDLLSYGLIEHHLVRENVRKEWYQLTEAGKRVVEHMYGMIEDVMLKKEGGAADSE
jgi:DNA-binding HxlR family transcriptional regulator